MKAIKDFISEGERLELLKWVEENKVNLIPAAQPYSAFCKIHKSVNNNIAVKIENRIKDRFNINRDNVVRQFLGSFMSILNPKAIIPLHKDSWDLDRGEHHRFNLVIQKPEKGGTPIYNGKKLEWENGDLFCYRPDINFHGSNVVEGNLDRVVLSCGWMLLGKKAMNLLTSNKEKER
jgi:hypothetical protein